MLSGVSGSWQPAIYIECHKLMLFMRGDGAYELGRRIDYFSLVYLIDASG